MASLQDQEALFSLSFHGGAGVIPQGAIDSGLYQTALSDVLSGAYAFAERNLDNPSIKAIDVAENCVKLLEDHELFNAGRGSVFTADATHEMEASIMDGSTLECGAVSLIKNYQNPISLAKLVMQKSAHVYLVGEGAENFAAEHNVPRVESNAFFSTERRFQQLQAAKGAQGVFMDHDLLKNSEESVRTSVEQTQSVNIDNLHTSIGTDASGITTAATDSSETGTVGCVVYYKGDVAAATSTGGMTNKRAGRVGDTPIIGAGTYANNNTCAVSCTGKGEMFMRSVTAYDISARMQYGGKTLKQAVSDALHRGTTSSTVAPAQAAARESESTEQQRLLLPPGAGGVISVDGKGRVVMDFNSEGMFRGWVGKYNRGVVDSSGDGVSESSDGVGGCIGGGVGSTSESGSSVGSGVVGSSNGGSSDGSVVLGQVGIWSELHTIDLTTTPLTYTPLIPTPSPNTTLLRIDPTDSVSMQRIGALRYQVWEEENSINTTLFPDRCWLDDLDPVGMHWVIQDTSSGEYMAAARMTIHHTLTDSYRDVQLWSKCGKHLPLPTVDLGRLVVSNKYRGRGLAQLLNITRMNVAHTIGARSIMVTASEGNARLLRKLGFEDIGETVYFEDRPNTCFYALQFNF